MATHTRHRRGFLVPTSMTVAFGENRSLCSLIARKDTPNADQCPMKSTKNLPRS